MDQLYKLVHHPIFQVLAQYIIRHRLNRVQRERVILNQILVHLFVLCCILYFENHLYNQVTVRSFDTFFYLPLQHDKLRQKKEANKSLIEYIKNSRIVVQLV